jgi:hypothetical protein
LFLTWVDNFTVQVVREKNLPHSIPFLYVRLLRCSDGLQSLKLRVVAAFLEIGSWTCWLTWFVANEVVYQYLFSFAFQEAGRTAPRDFVVASKMFSRLILEDGSEKIASVILTLVYEGSDIHLQSMNEYSYSVRDPSRNRDRGTGIWCQVVYHVFDLRCCRSIAPCYASPALYHSARRTSSLPFYSACIPRLQGPFSCTF